MLKLFDGINSFGGVKIDQDDNVYTLNSKGILQKISTDGSVEWINNLGDYTDISASENVVYAKKQSSWIFKFLE